MMNFEEPVDRHVKLGEIDPAYTGGIHGKEEVREQDEENLKKLYDLHYLMYAENRRALLVILHGIDASGKDGTIRHLASGLNPQGLKVQSFVKPVAEEIDHDYLWRAHKVAPGRGEVAIFNRSHYEEVTTVRIHPELLEEESLPQDVLNDTKIFKRRFRQINDFERMLAENGTIVLKFLLHISKEQQQQRIGERLTDPRKHWKFQSSDVAEQQFWEEYMTAYQKMLRRTSTKHAPWYVIPADHKWFRNHLVTRIIVEKLKSIDMKFPKLR